MTEQERTNIIKLAEKAGAGDAEAFEQLYKRTVSGLRSVCARYFQHAYDIDEALQETYVRIYRNLGTLSALEAFPAWSRTIAQNTCLNIIRGRNLVSRHESFAGVYPGEDPDSENDIPAEEYRKEWNPEAAAENEMKARILQEILDSVSDVQRSCILLWAEGYTYQNIAQRLGMPAGSVKSTVHYTKKKITGRILKIEKEQGISLHGMAPIPYFLWLLEADPEGTALAAGAGAAGTSAAAVISASDPIVTQVRMTEGLRHRTGPAFFAAAAMLLAFLLPAGSTLAASLQERTAPQDTAILTEAVWDFRPSNLVTGGSAEETVRASGIGAESGEGDTRRADRLPAEAEVAAPEGQNTSDDYRDAERRPSGRMHSRRGTHPEKEEGGLWQRMAGVFSTESGEREDRFLPEIDRKGNDSKEEEAKAPDGGEEAFSTEIKETEKKKKEENPISKPGITGRPKNTKTTETAKKTKKEEPSEPGSGSSQARDRSPSAGSGTGTPSGNASSRPGGNSSDANATAAVGTGSGSPQEGTSSGQGSADPSSGASGMNGEPETPVVPLTPPPENTPTVTPSAVPTETPTAEPTETPTPDLTETPTPEPTETPTPTPEEIPIESFRFTVQDLDFVLNAYEPVQIPFEIYPENATEKIVWSTQGDANVTIDENGVATFLPQEGVYLTAVNCVATANGATYNLRTLLSYNSTDVPYGDCGDGVTWRVDGDTLVISGSGPMKWQDPNSPIPQSRWIRFGSQIRSIEIEEGITEIGGFRNLTHVTEVVIPEGVTSIENMTFSSTGITRYYLPKSLTYVFGGDLDNGHGNLIEIIYAGSEEDWNNIFHPSPEDWGWRIGSITFLE